MKVEMGQIGATPALLDKVSNDDIQIALSRHASGDWGDVTPHDAAANDAALLGGYRIWSIYRSSQGITFHVITDAAREYTVVMLSDEY